jgi:hypothetical protein
MHCLQGIAAVAQQLVSGDAALVLYPPTPATQDSSPAAAQHASASQAAVAQQPSAHMGAADSQGDGHSISPSEVVTALLSLVEATQQLLSSQPGAPWEGNDESMLLALQQVPGLGKMMAMVVADCCACIIMGMLTCCKWLCTM